MSSRNLAINSAASSAMKSSLVIMTLFAVFCAHAQGDEIADDRFGDDPAAITAKNLPLSPIKDGQVVIAAGLTFDLVKWTYGIFDPNKEIPDLAQDKDGKLTITLSPTPSDYFVTDDVMTVCWEKTAGEPRLHSYREIDYRFKDPAAHLKSVTVLSYDNMPFCICFGNMPVEAPGLWSDARLQMQDGRTEIDVGHVESGTGAFNSHAYFSVSADPPKLTRLTSGGRGR